MMGSASWLDLDGINTVIGKRVQCFNISAPSTLGYSSVHCHTPTYTVDVMITLDHHAPNAVPGEVRRMRTCYHSDAMACCRITAFCLILITLPPWTAHDPGSSST